ncbi:MULTISPECIES: hypothetical protein [unclassified Mesorhizobium]|uniref:hypothetical protein n=1 Tax=unclassified Mesorhizobium TaxID=325217 RepID=UPI003339BBE2
MNKKDTGYGAGFVGGIILFLIVINVIYTDQDGFRPSWLNQITFWTVAIFVVAGILHSTSEEKRQREHEKWLAALSEEDKKAYLTRKMDVRGDE